MTSTFVIRDLYLGLREDEWRKDNDFSSEVRIAHEVLLNPFATSEQCKAMLSKWLQRSRTPEGPGHQPCLFGRIAAMSAMHYCILNENTLVDSDQVIGQELNESLLAWKRRSIDPEATSPAHGFMVILISDRIARAAPDDRLLELALAFRQLWGCEIETDPAGNDVALETLFLRNPDTREIMKFTFSIDYFGAQGDGRWWHDHRIPGGIAFTANSAGHMLHCRQWYANLASQNEWLLQTAMRTIDEAAATPYGRATWLRGLSKSGHPFLEDISCPVPAERLKPQLIGKDWTRYGGHLYSDHSIRREFFRHDPDKPRALKEVSWLEDFSYLYDESSADHLRFIKGEVVEPGEVEAELGNRREWRLVADEHDSFRIRSGSAVGPPEEAKRIAEALREADSWLLDKADVEDG